MSYLKSRKPIQERAYQLKTVGFNQNYLLIVSISVESVTLRSMKLNCCIIDYFYATLLLRKAQWAYPTVHRNWVFKTRLGSFVTGGFLGALVLTAFMVVSSELPRQRTRGMQDLVRG